MHLPLVSRLKAFCGSVAGRTIIVHVGHVGHMKSVQNFTGFMCCAFPVVYTHSQVQTCLITMFRDIFLT